MVLRSESNGSVLFPLHRENVERFEKEGEILVGWPQHTHSHFEKEKGETKTEQQKESREKISSGEQNQNK